MPTIQEKKKKSQVQSFHQEIVQWAQPWLTLSYKINWPEKKKLDTKESTLCDSFYEVQKQSKLVCGAPS